VQPKKTRHSISALRFVGTTFSLRDPPPTASKPDGSCAAASRVMKSNSMASAAIMPEIDEKISEDFK